MTEPPQGPPPQDPFRTVRTPTVDVPQPPQQRPPWYWALWGAGGCLGILVLMVIFAGCLAAIASPDQKSGDKSKEAANSEQNEPAPSAKEPDKQAEEKKQRPKKQPKYPEPRTQVEEIRHALNQKSLDQKSTRVIIQPTEGCNTVIVAYRTPFVGSSLPLEPPDYYRAVYRDADLRRVPCLVVTRGYGSTTDDFGNNRRLLLYATSMKPQMAQRINWRNLYSVNFSRLYETEYMHPSAKADIRRENARHAMDCLQDEGMFDFDLDC